MWGEDSTKVVIAVHGNLSSKADIPIRILAEEAVPLGYQVLSFDLPEHGDRKDDPILCKAQNCVLDLKKAVVDMQRLIQNMMKWFGVTKEQLHGEKEISTPMGQKLYWDYYQYVMENPIMKWNAPTSILYGKKDELCEYDVVSSFCSRFNCSLTISDITEHYFHTKEDLTIYREWLRQSILS